MRRHLVATVLVAVVAAACGGGAPGTASGATAATVSGDEIPSARVSEALDAFEKTDAFEQLSQQNGEQEARRLFEQGYLSRLIRRSVLEWRAEELGVHLATQQVDDQLAQIKSQFGDNDEAFQNALQQQGLTSALLERFIEDRVLEEQLRERVSEEWAPPDEELRSYYDSHLGDYREVRASHILVKKQQLAQSLSRKLHNAPDAKVADLFAALAKKHSTDGSAAQGGDLGWASPSGYVDEFARAAATLPIGQVSRPVKTQFGYHLIRVTDRRIKSFETVREQVAAQVSGGSPEEAWQEWLIEAYRDADIRVNPRYGELDLQTQQVVDATAEDVPGAEESPSPE